MKYILYLTTNTKSKINNINKIYIGVHKTEDPEVFDGYIGCGVRVQQPSTYMYPKTPFQYAVKKYGVDAFRRDILFIYDDEEAAYSKEAEIVCSDFIKQSHVYNSCLGGKCNCAVYKPLYQFNLDGTLKKFWETSKDAYDFYGYPIDYFNWAKFQKYSFLDSYWSSEPSIILADYTNNKHGSPKHIHLYNKDGKYLQSFLSQKECSEFLGTSIDSALRRGSLINDAYYVSPTIVDEFIPKPRRVLKEQVFYVYKNNELVGSYNGKEIMSVIGVHSWTKIRDILRDSYGWYKDFYISETPEIKHLGRKWNYRVDIFDKYGNYIETLDTIKEVKSKYKVPSCKIKNIQQGNKYFGDFIFKWNSK